eukprot:TRINITY_DN2685_c0_g1_i2.p1 TRINITY_DN2685_c0_g1~~TRINITY_DN2685_c0_g1_i2.p1  ORF type:complete len:106 (-),score=1.10 TRINITY_DN2685_c0_g1_i2:937-1254(-)
MPLDVPPKISVNYTSRFTRGKQKNQASPNSVVRKCCNMTTAIAAQRALQAWNRTWKGSYFFRLECGAPCQPSFLQIFSTRALVQGRIHAEEVYSSSELLRRNSSP